MPDADRKTLIQTRVDSGIHNQFSNLAGFLNPDMTRVDARNKLLEEVMKERIENEKKRI